MTITRERRHLGRNEDFGQESLTPFMNRTSTSTHTKASFVTRPSADVWRIVVTLTLTRHETLELPLRTTHSR